MKKILLTSGLFLMLLTLSGCMFFSDENGENASSHEDVNITLYFEQDDILQNYNLSHDELSELTSMVPDKFGHSLEGFYSMESVDEIDMDEPETLNLTSTKIVDASGEPTEHYDESKDYMLGVKWTPEEYTLIFNPGDATLPESPDLEYIIKYGEALPELMINYEDIRMPGLYFDHWNSREVALGEAYSDNEAWLEDVETFDKDTFEDAFKQSDNYTIELFAYYTDE